MHEYCSGYQSEYERLSLDADAAEHCCHIVTGFECSGETANTIAGSLDG